MQINKYKSQSMHWIYYFALLKTVCINIPTAYIYLLKNTCAHTYIYNRRYAIVEGKFKIINWR